MNVQNLKNRYPELITYMKDEGYSKDYIDRVRREIEKVVANVTSSNWQSYEDIYHDYANQGKSKAALKHRLASLGVIERFDVSGEFPDGRTRQRIVTNNKERYLSIEFKRIIDTFRDSELQRGAKNPNTIYRESRRAINFLYTLQSAGISKASEITQRSVIEAFMNKDGTQRWGRKCKYIIAVVFKTNVPSNPELFTRLMAYLPDLREVRKNIQYLTDEEITKIKSVLSNRNSGLSLRDTAIGTLALNYGLRQSDIAALKSDNVDMAGEKINIIQQKTGVPLELPLTAAVGNALYDYVTMERPKSDCEYVFLAKRRPFGRMTSDGFTNIAAAIMKAAGIRQNPGDRQGFHIFRHRLATKLLGNGVAQPVISQIVGHTSPVSLEVYLSADFVHLKECALSIEHLPFRGEVFTNE